MLETDYASETGHYVPVMPQCVSELFWGVGWEWGKSRELDSGWVAIWFKILPEMQQPAIALITANLEEIP